VVVSAKYLEITEKVGGVIFTIPRVGEYMVID
jgi:hypothetical protein